MNRLRRIFTAFLICELLAGCQSTLASPLELEPETFTEIKITSNIDTLPAQELSLAPGTYSFTCLNGQDDQTSAIYEIYETDELYDSMTYGLKQQLVAQVSVGQPATLQLDDGQYLYIVAQDSSGNAITDRLAGNLEIQEE